MIPTGFQVELLDYEDNSKITYRLIEPTYGERYLGAGFSHGERRIYTERVLTEMRYETATLEKISSISAPVA